MNSVHDTAAIQLQLTQYAEDFQELLARHTDLKLRHENLQASHTKLSGAGDILALLSRSVDDVCIAIDPDGYIKYASDSARTLLLLGKNKTMRLPQFLAPFHQTQLAQMLRQMRTVSGAYFEHTELVLYPAGDKAQARLFDILSLTLMTEAGPCAYWLMRDLSDRATAGLHSQRSIAMRQNIHQGLMVTDVDGTLLAIDPTLAATIGQPVEAVQGQHFSVIVPAGKNTAFDRDFWRALQIKGHWQGENNQLWLSVTAIKDAAHQICAYLWAYSDIHRLINAKRILLDTACHDALTGLIQLSAFCDLADERIKKAWHGGARVTLMFAALDRLQWIKDTEGDACADAVVMAASTRLQEQIRGCDLLARVAFDKFVILLRGPSNAADLHKIATRITESIAQPILFHKKTLFLRMRIGQARFPQDGIDTSMLLNHAEAALKPSPKGASSDHFMNHEFSRALARRELYLAYLPHVASHDPSQLLACEAQLRWRHPLLGDLAWQDFCEQAESKPFDVHASIWVLKTACETLSMWHAEGLNEITMVLNISPIELRSKHFTAALVETLTTSQINPLHLELTLSAAQNLMFPGIDLNYLRELRQLGVKIGIRNKHIGHTSLTQVNEPAEVSRTLERRVASGAALDLEWVGDSFNEVTRFELLDDHEELTRKTYRKGQPMLGSTFMNWALAQQVRYDAHNDPGLSA